MDQILFVGNGFNLISDNGVGWEGLLNRLAGQHVDSREKDLRKQKPFTLWFEEIAARGRRHRELKEHFAKFIGEGLEPNEHHQDLMALNCKHILTTNYDYTLETATADKWKSDSPARENFYSLFRRRSNEGRCIWHIHGEIENVSSIMLGHEQYSGYIQKIRNFLTSGVETSAKGRNGKPYLSKFSRKKNTSLTDVESWVDLFLEHEVHIIGFSLDYTENHLWNLIMEKQRLKQKGFKIGDTVFYHCSNKKLNVLEEAKLSILSALGVTVIDHMQKTYSDAYSKAIEDISNAI